MASFYNPSLDPTLPVSFFAAAYRFGHSLIPSAIERWSVSHQYVGIIYTMLTASKMKEKLIEQSTQVLGD